MHNSACAGLGCAGSWCVWRAGLPPPDTMARGAGAALLDTFRKEDFDLPVFVRDATTQGSDRVSKLTAQLEDVASTLDEELQRKIIACHEELLQNAGRISDLDGQLGDVRQVVETLKNSVSRVRSDVLVPFQGVKRRTVLLERMQAVNVLIRKLLRFLFDAKKLRTQMEAPTKDFSKAAHTLHELECVLEESSLERVDVLRTEVGWIRGVGSRIRRQAEEDLRGGAKQGNQLSLSVALQVFFNLRCLWPQLKRLLTEMLEEFVNVQLTAGAAVQQSLDMNLQVLVAQTQRVHVLDEVVRAKVDPLTNTSFTTALEEAGVTSLTAYFWEEATKALKLKFNRIMQDRKARRELVAECPKVLQALVGAMNRLSLASRGRGQVLCPADREKLVGAISDLRNEFLAESIRRVTDPVEMMLPDKLLSASSGSGVVGASDGSATDDLPTSHDLRAYVKLLVAELERSECCPDILLKDVTRNVRSSILLFAARLEQVVDSACIELRCFEDEANFKLRSPLPIPAAGHARNARLFGIAHHALAALKDAVPARFQATIISHQVQASFQQTQSAIISPMVDVLRRVLTSSTRCLQLGTAGRSATGSIPMLGVQQVCAHVGRYYFALYGSGQLIPHLKDLCTVAIRSFLAAASLVHIRDEHTRAALEQDVKTLETTLTALDAEFQSHIRHEAMVFKEFRKLLLAPSLAKLDFEELKNVIPLHLILAFLVHQLPSELGVPALPDFAGVTKEAFLENTILPLWDEPPAQVAAFKKSLAELSDKHNLDPTESPVVAFIMAQTD